MPMPINNRMWLQSLTDRELAERLINCSQEPDYTYNYDEELELWGFIDVYTTSDGTRFDDMDSAIEYEVEWFNKEHRSDESEDE